MKKPEKLFFATPRDLQICGILETPRPKSKEVVITVHGYTGNKDISYSAEIRHALVEKGMNSFGIDLGGCGESQGKFEEQTISTMVEDVTAAIKLMKTKGFKKIDLWGASAGGLASMGAALKNKINKMALAAPVSDYPSQRKRRYGAAAIREWKKRGYNYYDAGPRGIFKVNYTFYEDSKKWIMYSKARRIKCPVLIIHGNKDEQVDLNDSKKLAKRLPNAKLIVLKGANHNMKIKGDRSKATKLFVKWLAG